MDTSLNGATTSFSEGGSMSSWTDAWQGAGRPAFFYFDPSLQLAQILTGSSLAYDWSRLASETVPIFETMAASWMGCIAGDTFCDEAAGAPAGETIVIGGSSGWVVKAGNQAYEDIVANVGDILQFTYSSAYHDVVLVDNENCDFSAGTLVDETGDFAWQIPEPGTYIFACGRGNHCSSGNQQVTVIASGGQAEAECAIDVDGDGAVNVNDLLECLSAYGQSGELPADVTGDLVVDVADLLQVRAAARPLPMCFRFICLCCASWRDLIRRAVWQLLSAFGSTCEAEPAAAPACAQGDDCGGQVWTDCGSSCPSMCGTPDADFCNEMCNAEFQCPNGQCFNDATGACEDGTGR